ncbi:C-type lectin 37Db-like [Drosophila pseudoobscura]|uniref:C-type lectin 37Db-like n=1 Tax=Drosophila pseudoobscura pseudoobscura TaxID=46245 RepID=A0A6I8V5I5_DROPS|nr:C-type lectin 37Db [Drosophila pseudoobscura]
MFKSDVFLSIACLIIISSTVNSNDELVWVRNKKFFISPIKKNFYVARDLCKQNNADLATIESKDELVAISSRLLQEGYRSEANDLFWLAYFDVGRPAGKFYSIATGLPLNTTGWAAGQPDNAGGNEHCAHIWLRFGKYGMNDNNCNVELRAICEQKIRRTIC